MRAKVEHGTKRQGCVRLMLCQHAVYGLVYFLPGKPIVKGEVSSVEPDAAGSCEGATCIIAAVSNTVVIKQRRPVWKDTLGHSAISQRTAHELAVEEAIFQRFGAHPKIVKSVMCPRGPYPLNVAQVPRIVSGRHSTL